LCFCSHRTREFACVTALKVADSLSKLRQLDESGRVFLNNVSLGIYGDAVRQPAYRDAKVRTQVETAAEVPGCFFVGRAARLASRSSWW